MHPKWVRRVSLIEDWLALKSVRGLKREGRNDNGRRGKEKEKEILEASQKIGSSGYIKSLEEEFQGFDLLPEEVT